MPEYLAGGEPFYFEGNRIGCLLVHGFTGTPYEMRGLGSFLHRELGYTVAGPALAGHSTRPEDMACTEWPDWFASVEAAYRDLTTRCDQVFAIGLSLGGALVLHLAAEQSRANISSDQNRPHPSGLLRGVVAVSAPAYIRHRLEIWFRTFPILFRLVPFVKRNDSEDDTQDPGVRANHPGYERTPTACARSMILHFLPRVRAELPNIKTPVLLVQARGDRTIPGESMPIIYSELGSQNKQMAWLEKGGHLALEDYDSPRAFRLIADFVTRYSISILQFPRLEAHTELTPHN